MNWRGLALGTTAALGGLAAYADDLPSDAEGPRWYASIGAGADWVGVDAVGVALPLCGGLGLAPCTPDTSASTGWAAFASVGMSITDYLRIEGELGHRNATLGDRGDITNTTLMLNALVDAAITDSVSFSFGGGLGIDWITTEQLPPHPFNTTTYTSSFAYQAIAEVSCAVSENIDLTLTYRYLDTNGTNDLYADAAIAGGGTAVVRVDDVSASTISVGLRFAL
ncbi:MAG: porin family protein [Alphaproteobacteria bacterium]|nr:porin family protein [Alphaproteobacteria bacterium]